MENLDPVIRSALYGLITLGVLVLSYVIGKYIGALIKDRAELNQSPTVRILRVAASVDPATRRTAAGLWSIQSQLQDRDDITLEQIIGILNLDSESEIDVQQVKANYLSLQEIVARDPDLTPRLSSISLSELGKTGFDAARALRTADVNPIQPDPRD